MPVVTIGENTGDDFSGVEDCFLDGNNPTTNYDDPGFNYIWEGNLGRYLVGCSGLSNLPGSATFNDASLFIFVWDVYTSGNLLGRPLLVAFDETQATWNSRVTGTAWTTAGAGSDGNDRRATASFDVTIAGASEEYKEINASQFTIDLEDQYDGTINNYGYVIQADSSAIIQNSPTGDGSNPYFEIDYTVGGGATGAVLKYWSGAAWTNANLKRWDGSTHAAVSLYYYDGVSFAAVQCSG